MARLRRFWRLDGTYAKVTASEYERRTKLQRAAVERRGLHWWRNSRGRPAALTLTALRRRQGWREQAKRQRPPGSKQFRKPPPPPPAPPGAGRFPLPGATLESGADIAAWVSRTVEAIDAAIARVGPVTAVWSLDLRMDVHRPGRATETIERRIPVAVTAGESVGGGWLLASGERVLGTLYGGGVLDPDDWRRRIITDMQAQGLHTKSPKRPQGPQTQADMSTVESGPPPPPETPDGGAGAAGGASIEVSGWIEYDDGSL